MKQIMLGAVISIVALLAIAGPAAAGGWAVSTLGPPVALYRMPAGEGGVLLAWRVDTATLWVRPTREGDIIFRKLLASAEGVEPVDDLGTEALVLTEAHVLETPLRRLSAENVVIWYDEANEYRLEADLAPAALIDLARSFE